MSEPQAERSRPHPTDVTLDDLAATLAATGKVVSSLSDDQWSLATPCTEWDVTELVRHLVRGNIGIARQLSGGDESFLRGTGQNLALTRAPATDDAPQRPTLAETLERTSTELLHAYTAPGALKRTVILAVGAVPGTVAARIRTVDVLVHGWDLCAAAGCSYSVDEGVTERAHAFTVRSIGSMSTDHRPFGASTPVAPDAPVLDRLAGLLGRPVPWRP